MSILCRFKHKWKIAVWYFAGQVHVVRFCQRCDVLEEFVRWEWKDYRYIPIYERMP